MRQIPSLNALKLLAALAVVVIHAKVPVLTTVLLPLCKLAVPLFLMISGYCLMGEDGRLRKDSIGRAIPRIVRITLWSNLIYLICNVAMGLVDGTAMKLLLRLTELHFWANMLCFGGIVSAHLWYLVAYLQVLLFFRLLVPEPRVPRWVYWCIPFGLLLNLLLGNYGFLVGVHTPYHYSRNFITIALPCVALGMWLREHPICVPRWSLLMAVIALYVEAFLYKAYCPEHTGDIWLMTIPAAVVVLLSSIEHPQWGSGRLAEWGRKWSLPIYIWHFMLISIIKLLLK